MIPHVPLNQSLQSCPTNFSDSHVTRSIQGTDSITLHSQIQQNRQTTEKRTRTLLVGQLKRKKWTHQLKQLSNAFLWTKSSSLVPVHRICYNSWENKQSSTHKARWRAKINLLVSSHIKSLQLKTFRHLRQTSWRTLLLHVP